MNGQLFRKYRLHIIFPLLLLAVALVVKSPILLSSLALAIFLTNVLLEKESKLKLIRRYLLIAVFILLGTLPLLLNKHHDSNVGFQIGSWAIDSLGIHNFSVVSLRCLAAIGTMMLLIRITPIYDLCAELREMKVPKLIVDLFELTYRYIFVLEDITKIIKVAQTSRLGYQGFKNTITDTGLLIAQTFVLTHQEADHLYDGLISRGYDDEAPCFKLEEMGENKTLIELEDIFYGYEKANEVLKGINLQIFEGEKIALLGENGAGKSTLMLLMDGVLQHPKGIYKLFGKPVDNSKESMNLIRQAVALVFQNSNHQLFTPSVQSEIAYGLKNIGIKEPELTAQVEKILCEFHLENMRDLPPHKLSEGQKKWLSIAAVLAINPRLIILDEPTSNLDRYFTNEVLSLLERLHDAGKSIMLSTHDMNFAYKWADRIIVMHNGQIIADGPKDQIFNNDEILRRANLDKPLYLQLTNPQ